MSEKKAAACMGLKAMFGEHTPFTVSQRTSLNYAHSCVRYSQTVSEFAAVQVFQADEEYHDQYREEDYYPLNSAVSPPHSRHERCLKLITFAHLHYSSFGRTHAHPLSAPSAFGKSHFILSFSMILLQFESNPYNIQFRSFMTSPLDRDHR